MASDATCWTLIESAGSGDGAAREAFVARYLPVVRAYFQARWSGRLEPGDVEDAVQDVFVECLREEGVLEQQRPRPRGGFRAYLFGVARNVGLRIETRNARRLDAVNGSQPAFELALADESSSSRVFDRNWARAIMREAAERQRELAGDRGASALRRVELLRRIFQEGARIAELAREWGEPPERLHREYARAREEFADVLREVVAFHAPGSGAEIERECADLVRLLEGE